MNSAWRRRLTLAAMCIAQGMILLDVTIVNVALPSIQRELHESPGELEWVISAYAGSRSRRYGTGDSSWCSPVNAISDSTLAARITRQSDAPLAS